MLIVLFTIGESKDTVAVVWAGGGAGVRKVEKPPEGCAIDDTRYCVVTR